MLGRNAGLYLAVTLAFASPLAIAQVGGLPQEISAREAADARLRNSINDETAARALGEARLQGNIDAEAAARTAADTALRGSIESEAGARASADTQLQNQINDLRANGSGGNTGGGSVTVDCATGGLVSQALAAGAQQITVRGTCRESLDVARDGVTLQAEPGATIEGPDPSVNTINVRANRVTIDGLTVTRGRNGITGLGAANLTLRNCVVDLAGRNGISYANGSSGTVEGCTVRFSGRDGIVVDGAQGTIVNSTVTDSTRHGIAIVNGGTSRIGLTDRLTAAGNTISQNGSIGIVVSLGATATIAANSVTGNGTNAASTVRFGISVGQATATIVGGNIISDNSGIGVIVTNGSGVVLGDPNLGLPTVNTISRNGNAASAGGVLAFLGSSLIVRDAVIDSNNGPGLTFGLQSRGQLFNTTITNSQNIVNAAGLITNPGDGIRLFFGSALQPVGPTVNTVSANAGVGLACSDFESSVPLIGGTPAPIPPAPPAPPAPPTPPFVSFSSNGQGDLRNCTGF